MSISGVNGIGATAYAYTNSSKKTVEESNFASEVQKAGESQNTTATASAWAGDMVIPYPPNYSGFTYDSSISNKSKEEMTMDEYKQWVMNEMSQIPHGKRVIRYRLEHWMALQESLLKVHLQIAEAVL